MNPQAYYATHSQITDPGQYAYLFDDLPNEIDALCRIVQGTYIHYWSGEVFNYTIPDKRKQEVNTWHMALILARMTALSNRPLDEPRSPEQRFVGCCRDAALLLCAMLRHKGIPARTRVGFAPYINIKVSGFNVDHVITEYWDAEAARWKLVDPEQSDMLIEMNHIQFDVHDIPAISF